MIRVGIAVFTIVVCLLIEGARLPARAQDLPLCGQWVEINCGIDRIPALQVCNTDHYIVIDALAEGLPYPLPMGQYWRVLSLDKAGDDGGFTEWCRDYSIEPGFIGAVRGETVDSCAACQAPDSTPNTTPPTIEFRADRTDIGSGECTWLVWKAEHVREVYLNGEGVAGDSAREVCPIASTTYSLRVVHDGGEEYRSLTVDVRQPNPEPDRDDSSLVSSSGDQTYQPGQPHTVRFTFRNVGTTTWTSDHYGFQGIHNWQSIHPPFFCGTVPPGAECEMSLNGNAQTAPGTYTYGVVLQHDGVDFGATGSVQITVINNEPPPEEPTPTPVPAQPDAPDVDNVTVHIPGGVNLRSGPGTNFKPPVATTTSSGTYDVRGKNNGWYLACCYRDEEFWVSGGVTGVRVTGDLAGIQFVPAPARNSGERALQAKLKFLQNHSNCLDGTTDGCGYDWKFFTVEVRGINQNGDSAVWPSPEINCKPYAEQAFGATGLCQAELLTRDFWWEEGNTIEIEYGAIPVNNIFRLGVPISEPTKYGSCSVTVPDRFWPFEREFEVIINPDTQECTPKN